MLSQIKNPMSPPVWLIFANTLPLIGVFAFGWEAAHIVIFFWVETGIIGLYTILKYLVSETPKNIPEFIAAIFIVCFFCVHFGGFMAIQGLFIMLMLKDLPRHIFDYIKYFALILFIFHGILFYLQFIRSGDYKAKDNNNIMLSPYGRIIIQQFLILGGGYFVFNNDQNHNIGILTVLIIMKTSIDLMVYYWGIKPRGRSKASY